MTYCVRKDGTIDHTHCRDSACACICHGGVPAGYRLGPDPNIARRQKLRERRENAKAMFVIAAIIAAASVALGPIGLIIDVLIFLVFALVWIIGAITMIGSIGAGPPPPPTYYAPRVPTMWQCPLCHKILPPGPDGKKPPVHHSGGPYGGEPQPIEWR